MKTILALAALASVTTLAVPAFAETNVSVGYSRVDAGDFKGLNAGVARFGWNSGAFGVEGEASTGFGSVKVGATAAKLSSEYGVFATAKADASKDFTLFARAGYVVEDLSLKVGAAASHSFSDSGLAYGAGAIWNVDEANGVRFEYTRYETSPTTATAKGNIWSLSYVRKFK